MEMVNLDSDEAWETWSNSMIDQLVEYAREYDKKQKAKDSQVANLDSEKLNDGSLKLKRNFC